MINKIERIFNIYTIEILGGCYAGNVYGIDGIAPTINCMGGGNRMPLILVEMEEMEPKIVGYTRDSKGKVVKRSLRGISNTVSTFTGSGHNTDMYVAEPINIVGQYDSSQNSRVIVTDGVSNTLTTSTQDNMLAMPELRMEDGCLVGKDGKRYRIRKLTPTECFRLMDVEDKDIEKMKSAGIAKTNLYKLAGNSIVVSCMYHIFRKMLIDKENENQQLELF